MKAEKKTAAAKKATKLNKIHFYNVSHNCVSFHIIATVRTLPPFKLPEDWIVSEFKDPRIFNDVDIPAAAIKIEANFSWNWFSSLDDEDLMYLKAGTELFNWVNAEGPDLICADVSNDID